MIFWSHVVVCQWVQFLISIIWWREGVPSSIPWAVLPPYPKIIVCQASLVTTSLSAVLDWTYLEAAHAMSNMTPIQGIERGRNPQTGKMVKKKTPPNNLIQVFIFWISRTEWGVMKRAVKWTLTSRQTSTEKSAVVDVDGIFYDLLYNNWQELSGRRSTSTAAFFLSTAGSPFHHANWMKRHYWS